MAMIGELASPHPVQVLPQTPVFEAARRMADLGIGDVIVTDEQTGAVVGMVTDRDLVVRVVAANLDPATTPVGDICTTNVTTATASDDVATAEELMRHDAIRRLPIVDDDGTLAGIVSLMDLAASGYVADDELREVLKSIGRARRDNRASR